MIFVAKLLNLGQVPKKNVFREVRMKMFMRSFQVNKQEQKEKES